MIDYVNRKPKHKNPADEDFLGSFIAGVACLVCIGVVSLLCLFIAA